MPTDVFNLLKRKIMKNNVFLMQMTTDSFKAIVTEIVRNEIAKIKDPKAMVIIFSG